MIGDRVRWGQPDPDGIHAHRGGVVRAVTLANGQWHALVQRADGTYGSEIVTNLASVEPGASVDALKRELAEVQAELIVERDRILQLRAYITEAGLEDAGASALDDACGAAIELLKTFQVELVAAGAARDAAEVNVKEALGLYHKAEAAVTDAIAERDAAQAVANELTIERDGIRAQRDTAIAERDAALKHADELGAELEAKKSKPGRNRGPERIG